MIPPARRAGVALAVGLLLLPVLSAAAFAAPPRPAACSVSILQPEATVSVVASPLEAREAVAYATVTITKPQLVTVRVVFNASTDIGWAADVDPSSIVVSDGDGVVAAKITVTIPPGAPAGNRAHVLFTAEPEAGLVPCKGASSTNLEVLSAPWVDRFEGRIVDDSLVVSDDARQVEFRVELFAVANTAIHVRIDYIVEPGVQVDGPRSLDLNPQQGGWDNASFIIAIDGRYLSPGLHNFSMKVWGDVEDYPTLEGDLGMSVLIPLHPVATTADPAPAPLLGQPSSWIEVAIGLTALALVLVVSAPVAAILYKRRRRHARRAARQRSRA